MKMNAPTTPPVHRLPVLTEVVQLEDELPQGLVADSPTPEQIAFMPVLLDVAEMPDEPFMASADPALQPLPPERVREGQAPRREPEWGQEPAAPFVPAHVPQAPSFRTSAFDAPSFASPFSPSDASAHALSESAQQAAVAAATALEEARDLPGSELPQPPQWLRRRPEAPAALPLPAVAPPSPLPPDFSGSWWSRDDGHVPPDVVPRVAAVPHQPATPSASPAVSEVELVRRVMRDLDGQLDHMFDHRMREVIAPALARAADALMADLRERLAVTVRDMVARAVTVELARQQRPADPG